MYARAHHHNNGLSAADQRTKAVESFALENLETFQEECSGGFFKIESPTRTK
jgi:hypothetical protein